MVGTIIKTFPLRGMFSISKVENPKLFTFHKYRQLCSDVNRKGHAAVCMTLSYAMCGNINNYGASILLIGQPYHCVFYPQNI